MRHPAFVLVALLLAAPFARSAPAQDPAVFYEDNCASCHTLGSLDLASATGPELSLKGGKLNTLYSSGAAGHQGITLAASELSALKILLNAN